MFGIRCQLFLGIIVTTDFVDLLQPLVHIRFSSVFVPPS